MAIQICVPKEVRKGEQRVALVPDIVNRLVKQGLRVKKLVSNGFIFESVKTLHP